MKKLWKIFFLVVVFFIIVVYLVNTFKTDDLSSAHTTKLIPDKIYSENLSDICNKTILSIIDTKPEKVKIPDDKVSVYILDDVATVDFKIAPDFSGNFEFEQVFIYSIVNTLTQEDGVMTVEFTVNGKSEPSFNGGIDMSETFIPDYNII